MHSQKENIDLLDSVSDLDIDNYRGKIRGGETERDYEGETKGIMWEVKVGWNVEECCVGECVKERV